MSMTCWVTALSLANQPPTRTDMASMTSETESLTGLDDIIFLTPGFASSIIMLQNSYYMFWWWSKYTAVLWWNVPCRQNQTFEETVVAPGWCTRRPSPRCCKASGAAWRSSKVWRRTNGSQKQRVQQTAVSCWDAGHPGAPLLRVNQHDSWLDWRQGWWEASHDIWMNLASLII